MFFYGASGLSMQSEIALPGLIPLALDDLPDIIVRHGSVPAALENATASGPTWQMADRRFLLHIPGTARFLLESGRDIVIEADAGATAADIAIFLIGTVLGILLHQREHIVLHASAVCVNGKAVLFCGPSGAGKSTMAAALAARGFRLVTDDLCAVTTDAPGGPMVQPDGRFLKLWAHTIDGLGLAERRRGAVRETLQKYYVEPDGAYPQALPLGVIYELREARPPHAPGIDRPNVVDAAICVRRSAYRRLLVRRMGQRVIYFHAATTIAGRVGIFSLTRPLTFAAVPDVVSWLERHWSEIGLTADAA